MWAGFDPLSNPLLSILEAADPGPWTVVADERRLVDLEVGSVYPTRWDLAKGIGVSAISRGMLRSPLDVRESFQTPGKSASARVGIWYTAENRRPPTDGWDATLSFDSNGWPRNAYLPFWQLNSDLFGGSFPGLLGETLSIDGMLTSRQGYSDVGSRPGFCCAILRNPDPVRLKAIELLNRIGPVDIYGPLARKPVPSKASIFRQYRFALVFENDLYPGYVTEKAFDAWHCGSIPLYWGLDSAESLNPKAIVNMATLADPFELVEAVADLERDPDSMGEMASLPLLLRKPDSAPVIELVRRVLRS